jgi:hypothetical protein
MRGPVGQAKKRPRRVWRSEFITGTRLKQIDRELGGCGTEQPVAAAGNRVQPRGEVPPAQPDPGVLRPRGKPPAKPQNHAEALRADRDGRAAQKPGLRAPLETVAYGRPSRTIWHFRPEWSISPGMPSKACHEFSIGGCSLHLSEQQMLIASIGPPPRPRPPPPPPVRLLISPIAEMQALRGLVRTRSARRSPQWSISTRGWLHCLQRLDGITPGALRRQSKKKPRQNLTGRVNCRD